MEENRTASRREAEDLLLKRKIKFFRKRTRNLEREINPKILEKKIELYNEFEKMFLSALLRKQNISANKMKEWVFKATLFASDKVVRRILAYNTKLGDKEGLVIYLRILLAMRQDLMGESVLTPLEIGKLLISDLEENPELRAKLSDISISKNKLK